MSTKIVIEMVEGSVLVYDNISGYVDDDRLFKIILTSEERIFIPVKQIKMIKIKETNDE